MTIDRSLPLGTTDSQTMRPCRGHIATVLKNPLIPKLRVKTWPCTCRPFHELRAQECSETWKVINFKGEKIKKPRPLLAQTMQNNSKSPLQWTPSHARQRDYELWPPSWRASGPVLGHEVTTSEHLVWKKTSQRQTLMQRRPPQLHLQHQNIWSLETETMPSVRRVIP